MQASRISLHDASFLRFLVSDFISFRGGKLGYHCQRLSSLCQVDLTAQKITSVADFLRVVITGIPLAMEIIGHVDKIIHDLANLHNWKLLQIPVGSRNSDGDRFAGEEILERDKEGEVVRTVLLASRTIIWEIRGAMVLLVNINTTKVICRSCEHQFEGSALLLLPHSSSMEGQGPQRTIIDIASPNNYRPVALSLFGLTRCQ